MASLASREVTVRDAESPPMNELQAVAIERNDPGVLDYFVSAPLCNVNITRRERKWWKSMPYLKQLPPN